MQVNQSTYFRQRLRQMEEVNPEPSTLGDCDCTSYSYFFLSVVFFTFGLFITVLTLSGGDYLYLHLGHMWLVGPILCSSGLMVAVKSILYLRRKSVIQMLLRQRTLLRGLQEIAQQQGLSVGASPPPARHASTLTLPPAYDLLVGSGPSEPPPPSYEEAMFLIDEKSRVALLATRLDGIDIQSAKETA